MWEMREAFTQAAVPLHGMPHSLAVTLPPLSVLFLKRIWI